VAKSGTVTLSDDLIPASSALKLETRMASVATGQITVAEFEQLTASTPGPHELRHGVRIGWPRSFRSAPCRSTNCGRLTSASWTGSGCPPLKTPTNTWAARRRSSSPSKSIDELDDRRLTCFEGGCREFWVVNPRRRTVQILDRDGNGRIYTGDQAVPVSLSGQFDLCLTAELNR